MQNQAIYMQFIAHKNCCITDMLFVDMLLPFGRTSSVGIMMFELAYFLDSLLSMCIP